MTIHPLDLLIREEFNKIANSDQYVLKYDIKCVIHAPNEDIKAMFVLDFSLLRDYINNFSDVLSITAVFGAGTVSHRIIPYGKTLEATVTLRPLANVPAYLDSNSASIKEYRYKALVYDNSVSAIENNLASDVSRVQRDKEDITSVTFQLINPLQEKLRAQTFGGSIRNAIPLVAIRTLLTRYSKIEGIEEQYAVKGVDVAPGYSTTVRDHIIVPHSTPLIRVPLLIERVVGGIYSTGFQYYLQKNFWFIFSPYNVKAYAKSDNTLTVINVAKDKLAQLEKTFRVTPTQVILLATGEVKFTRLSDRAEYNESLGTRFISAKNVLGSAKPSGGYGTTGGNKLVINRADNINEFQAPTSQETTFTKESPTRITSKLLSEYSNLAYKSGAMLQFIWENGVEDLIVPGMATRFIYMDGKLPKQVYGTVVAVESTYISETPGIIQKKFANTLIVSCFVEDVIKAKGML